MFEKYGVGVGREVEVGRGSEVPSLYPTEATRPRYRHGTLSIMSSE